MTAMEIEHRIKNLEDDSKLLKGELKATMSNIRDFLSGMRVPEDLTWDDGEKKNAELPEEPADDADAKEEINGETQESSRDEATEGDAQNQADDFEPDGATLVGGGGGVPPAQSGPEPDLFSGLLNKPGNKGPHETEEDIPAATEETSEKEEQIRASTSSKGNVNPLISLIRWVETAKRELGRDQLPALLDVYSVVGPQPTHLKEIILKLADLMTEPAGADSALSVQKLMTQQLATFLEMYRTGGQEEIKNAIVAMLNTSEAAARPTRADTWSRLILELHGIVTGNEDLFEGDNLLGGNNNTPPEKEEEPPKEEERPVKIKLVLPSANGGQKEFAITLQPEPSE